MGGIGIMGLCMKKQEQSLGRRIISHAGSRKWTAAMVGTACVMTVYGITLGSVFIAPTEKAQTLMAIGNMAVVFLGAITGSLVSGQSLVDWRHGSQSQFTAEEHRSDSRQEQIERTFAPKHYDDETIS